MAENIEKLDSNAFVDPEGNIRNAADMAQEGIEPNLLRDANQIANLRAPKRLEPSPEDIAESDAFYDQRIAALQAAEGVSMPVRSYIQNIHNAMDYTSAHAKAVALEHALDSPNDNAVKHKPHAADMVVGSFFKAESLKPKYNEAMVSLARTAALLDAGFTMRELEERGATQEDIERDFADTYGPGQKPAGGRWRAIDKIRKVYNMSPRKKATRKKKARSVEAMPKVSPQIEDEPLLTLEEEERLLPTELPTPVFEKEMVDASELSPAAAKHASIIANAINHANEHGTLLNIQGARSVGEYLAVDVLKDKDVTTTDYNQLLDLYNIR